MTVGQDAVVTVAPIDPDSIVSDLAEFSHRGRSHGVRMLLRRDIS
jgi:hypothetical protein